MTTTDVQANNNVATAEADLSMFSFCSKLLCFCGFWRKFLHLLALDTRLSITELNPAKLRWKEFFTDCGLCIEFLSGVPNSAGFERLPFNFLISATELLQTLCSLFK